jgi:hypothetical protein
VVFSYLLESSVHGPDLCLGELCLPKQLPQLNTLLVLGRESLGHQLLGEAEWSAFSKNGGTIIGVSDGKQELNSSETSCDN